MNFVPKCRRFLFWSKVEKLKWEIIAEVDSFHDSNFEQNLVYPHSCMIWRSSVSLRMWAEFLQKMTSANSSGVVYGGHLATRSYASAGQGQDGWDDEVAYLLAYKVFLIKSCGGLFLWNMIWGLGRFGLFGKSRIHEFLLLLTTISGSI